MFDHIVQKAEALEAELVDLRRDLHMHPEVGWEEFRTSAIVAQRLTDLGYEVLVGEDVLVPEERMGVPHEERLEAAYQRALDEGADPFWVEKMKGGLTGVVGILRNGDGPTVGLRFDIDALPMTEIEEDSHLPFREGFVSRHPGEMHSCGHDGHVAIGLGVATVLKDIADSWSGTVKFMFQPAEEGVRGAKSMVAKGHLDDAQYMLGSHLTQRKPGVAEDIFPGAGGALATTKLDVTYIGKASHAGSSPQHGHNALQAMATAVLGLYGISRTSEGATRVNVGVGQAGIGRSSIPYQATMQVEVRGSTTGANAFMEERARRVIQHAAEMYECEWEIDVVGGAISLESDPELMERIARVVPKVGITPTEQHRMLSPGSEDYAFMMERVQSNGGLASFIRVLSDSPTDGHTVDYDFEEACIVKGIKTFCAVVYDLLQR